MDEKSFIKKLESLDNDNNVSELIINLDADGNGNTIYGVLHNSEILNEIPDTENSINDVLDFLETQRKKTI